MKNYFLIGVLTVFMLSISMPTYADQWVDVGPTSMPLSDLRDLQKMVEGGAGTPTVAQSAKPEMVNAGLASLTRADFLMIAGLVSGEVEVDQNSSFPSEELIDLGIITIGQDEMETLSRMVQKGLLQHWYASPQLDVAVQ
jgi:hypothetical protein